MQKKQYAGEKALLSLGESMTRWRESAMHLQRLSRLQMESLLGGDTQAFGQVLWQKQAAQRDFRKLAAQVSTLRMKTCLASWDSEMPSDLSSYVASLKQAERDITGLLREAARFESRSEEILRLKMRRARAA